MLKLIGDIGRAVDIMDQSHDPMLNTPVRSETITADNDSDLGAIILPSTFHKAGLFERDYTSPQLKADNDTDNPMSVFAQNNDQKLEL